jgi:hypothetical protein
VRVGEETLTSFNFCPLKVGGPLTQAFSAACQFSLCHSLSLSLSLTLQHYTTLNYTSCLHQQFGALSACTFIYLIFLEFIGTQDLIKQDERQIKKKKSLRLTEILIMTILVLLQRF